jgi:hypothetical protein
MSAMRGATLFSLPFGGGVQFPRENNNMDLNPSSVVADRGRPKLSRSERKIVAYLSGIAAGTPDRRVSKSIREIAEATGLARRTVQPILQDLNRDERRVIRILSKNKEKTLIEIPLEHWPSPAGNPEPVVEQPANPKPALPPPASISELIFRMTDKRPTAEDIRKLKATAETDNEELMKVLDFLWRRGFRFAGFELLTVAVVHQLLVWKNPYEYR